MLFEEIVSDYMEHSRRNKRSHNNDRGKELRFLELFKGRMAADVTTKEVEDFRAAMMAEKKVATVNQHLKFLSAAYNRAIRQGRLHNTSQHSRRRTSDTWDRKWSAARVPG